MVGQNKSSTLNKGRGAGGAMRGLHLRPHLSLEGGHWRHRAGGLTYRRVRRQGYLTAAYSSGTAPDSHRLPPVPCAYSLWLTLL